MAVSRKPFQGILNIIRFNWHFYLISMVAISVLLLLSLLMDETIQPLLYFILSIPSAAIIISMLVSFYIYDVSELYKFNWLEKFTISEEVNLLNLNAGFDETSELLKEKYSNPLLTICDFYDPKKHTEISLKRARKAYLPNGQTICVKSNKLPFAENLFDHTIAFLTLHEIREVHERISIFREIHRVTKPNGLVFITEHLRDLNNFFAYNIGFFHFHSKSSWLDVFEQAHFTVKQEVKTTPFVTTFILEKNGGSF